MHILLIHQAFIAVDEAGGTRHHELSLYLAEAGHRITIISSPVSYLTGSLIRSDYGKYQSDSLSNITYLHAHAYRGLHRSFAHRLYGFFTFMLTSFWIGLFVKDVDLVWGTSPPLFQALTALVLARLKRIPLLFEVRDLWPAFAVEVGVLRNPILIRLSELLERFLYRHADHLVANSPGYIEYLKDHGARKVSLIPNGTDPTMFKPDDRGSEFRNKHSLTEKFVVVYAGAHGLSNDLGVVLQAAQLLSNYPNIQFVLLGDGKDKPALISLAAKMYLNNLLFLPPIPKLQIPEALAAADACLAILKPAPMFKLVYPNKVFDYMAAGRPVILAIDGVIRDVVEGVQAGIFVQPGNSKALADAVLNLSTFPDSCKRMGVNGRRLVEEKFSRPKLAEEFRQLMELLVHAN